MNMEYDLKFEEMKKYIPFLENMITRLESTNTTSSNPRQAQLDKIRSLRDLLSNKKKRMKMENLLKCEQVLINLYAKVEQRDTLTDQKTDLTYSFDSLHTIKEKSDLETVRNKLKTVAKQQNNVQDTLPEILARCEVSDVHTSGTKEPALFQRRPNQQQNPSEDRDEKKTPPGSASKRNYTRVLVSPESSSRRWSSSHTAEKPLFSRRSPRVSPRRYSPTYHKKERKKSKDSTKQSRKHKDLNITLNVPEESLSSLNTKDILSRIINCSDGDVDIDTLRELRKQILGELKKTGAKDDISDLILRSYKNKKNNITKDKEIEEGELSDSESEAIESIYGSLVVKEPGQSKNSPNQDSQPRKIQICLVINSEDKPASEINEVSKHNLDAEFMELEMYETEEKKENLSTEHGNKADLCVDNIDIRANETLGNDQKVTFSETNKNDKSFIESDKISEEKLSAPISEHPIAESKIPLKQDSKTFSCEPVVPSEDITAQSQDSIQFKANFYKPLTDPSTLKAAELDNNNDAKPGETKTVQNVTDIDNSLKKVEKSTEIPLLHDRTIKTKPPENTLSEIDILQALKKEILSDITVPGTETTTPLLHQPKVIKVASAQEILPKKRISIEKYKEKSVIPPKLSLDKVIFKDDHIKKPSLKLTHKECERFFSVPKISIDEDDESLDENDDKDIDASDIYEDLAPKSPDLEDANSISTVPPVIIPIDPVKTIPVNYKGDVDMRTLPLLSPNNTNPSEMYSPNIVASKNDISFDKKTGEHNVNPINSHNRPVLLDPRVRDFNTNITNMSPNNHTGNLERTPRHGMYSVSSSATPSQMTPNARKFEMTPTHQSFEIDNSNRKHVYVPTMSYYDGREREKSVTREGERQSRMDDTVETSYWNPSKDMSQNTRFNDMREDLFNRSDCSSFGTTDVSVTATQSFTRIEASSNAVSPYGRSDCPNTNHSYGRLECPPTPSQSFGRLECPPTPSHSFGRLECPPTPNPSFGRLECPPTPSHPFGRMECPPTPSHPFGRMECPPTPSHLFGRLECPSTPNHSFGRSDCPSTPSHPSGRSEGPPPLMHTLIDCPTPNSPYVGTDCPPTPLFGRNECPPTPSRTYSPSDCVPSPNALYSYERPQTPSHHFGRSETIKSQFGRRDYNTQKYNKDPRLNRKSESEFKSHFEEKDHSFYKDRDRYSGNSFSSPKIYSGSDTYRGYDKEQSISRNNKYKYYGPEYRGRQERSMGHSMQKDEEKEGIHTNRDRRYSDVRNYEEVGSKRDYYRENSVGRTVRQPDNRPSIRTNNIGRSLSRDSDSHKLSVTTTVGPSFTIDTSINATFQKIIDSAKEIQGFVNSFDTRRERAASVGRSLARESSVDRKSKKALDLKSNEHENKRLAFRRASSVGRDLCDNTDKRSLQEIKDDFKTYNFSGKKSVDRKKESEYTGRNRIDLYEKHKRDQRAREYKNYSYSPRKNYRDPRLRRQIDKKYDRYSPDAYSRKSGIVYSNDNIVAGSILASGYGVKNYKIPKIKRNTEEKEVIVENKDTLEKKNELVASDKIDKVHDKLTEVEKSDNKKQKDKLKVTDVNKEIEQTETDAEENKNRVARPDDMSESCDDKKQANTSELSVIDPNTDTEVLGKQKKHKKIIFDSESDTEIERKDSKDNPITEIRTKETDSPIKQKKSCKHLDSKDLDSNLGIDELEIFNDNNVSDPIIDNINDLIADLDSDINTSKNDNGHNFTKEISVENMMENISSPHREKYDETQLDDDSVNIINAIDNISNDCMQIPVVDKTKNTVSNKDKPNSQLNTQEPECHAVSSEGIKVEIDKQNVLKAMETAPSQSDAVNTSENKNLNNISSTTLVNSNNNDIDSTSEIQNCASVIEAKSPVSEIMDSCSTPDSTINTDDAIQKSSNNEVLSGNSHEVTSTETIEPKPSSSMKETAPALDSIGSLLSILDKSKIKELLNMLDDKSSETEKIKKKLEKLSEIVSDDEEICNEVVENKTEERPGSDNNSQESKTYTSIENIDDNRVGNVSDVGAANDAKPEKDIGDSEMQETDANIMSDEVKIKKRPVKKRYKNFKKVKSRPKRVTQTVEKRVTRATAPEIKQKAKKPVRELMQLQEDIKGMFIRDDVLSATGIRMCRLAKLVDTNTSQKEDTVLPESGPLVVLEKIKNAKVKETDTLKKKNILSKLKIKPLDDNVNDAINSDKLDTPTTIYKAGPKSKTKNKKETDPYAFESDSVGDNNTEKASDDWSSNSSDFESESLASSKSFGSTEILCEVKKKTKRKRPGWQAGIIKPKNRKKKIERKQVEPNTFDVLLPDKMPVPDLNCFTDRNYCFHKNQLDYSCRLCSYNGGDIVLHYKNQHPHVEIPLSRMPPDVAKEAIEQCEEVNFKAISKTASDKYVCIFCYKEFVNCKSVLETFFWHIVSTHTGEFKQHCSECNNACDCPFKLHIPPPPEDKQLIGYICDKCNFTQISLENLKTHVIVRHDDKQTAVYTINLSVMTKKALKSLLRRSEVELAAQNFTRFSNQCVSEANDNTDDIPDLNDSEGVQTRRSMRKANLPITPTIQSKITFEGDDNISEISDLVSETDEISIKTERVDSENNDRISMVASEEYPSSDFNDSNRPSTSNDGLQSNDIPVLQSESSELQPSDDILDYPHFKINLTESGGKVYYCCINGNYHFKTTLLISMKKHVQSKHLENWDGYCYICKVIVTPQGVHKFRDCLQHYLDKHMDNFPTFEEESVGTVPAHTSEMNIEPLKENAVSSSPKINVRPLSDLIVRTEDSTQESSSLPIIQSVTSLGTSPVASRLSPYPVHAEEETVERKIFKYEEHQAQVISKKYYLVVQAMMSSDNLIRIFKCSGRFCSYTTDSPQEALAHATTHQRIGGADAMNCSYCDFNAFGNAVDLVIHVFKMHGSCQYCCQQCFYRAVSSQCVGAHISRVHGASPLPGSVLRTTAISSILPVQSKILSREQAVTYYICGHSDGFAPCKFRTYTPDKFCEHLEQRHTSASEHPCHSCSTKFLKAAELVRHMKDHGIMLYQCTWCVHGADKESGLLDHISIMHPDKAPQAYIRMITNKEGSLEQRVLPLAFLNKFKVPTKEMIPTPTKENPEREAKRSIEMEALIGPFVSDISETHPDNVDKTAVDQIDDPLMGIAEETPEENIDTEIMQTADMSQNIESPVKDKKPVNVQISEYNSQISEDLSAHQMSNKSIKIEVATAQKNTITDICVLDSEDEISTPSIQTIIELSDDETAPISKPDQQTISKPDQQTISKPDQQAISKPDQQATPKPGKPTVSNPEENTETSASLESEQQAVSSDILHTCPKCKLVCKSMHGLRKHAVICVTNTSTFQCPHCSHIAENFDKLMWHYMASHSGSTHKSFECKSCGKICLSESNAKRHLRTVHKETNMTVTPSEKDGKDGFVYLLFSGGKIQPETSKERTTPKRKLSSGSKSDLIPVKRRFNPQEIDQLPLNPILDQLVYCSQCEFSTKVRLNMVRHLQLHAEQQPVPQKAPVNPVPHLESNEKHFDKMANLASSSAVNRTPDKPRVEVQQSVTLLMPPDLASRYPKYVPERQRHTCGAKGCSYISVDEAMLRRHWDTLHSGTSDFHCVHCPPQQHLDTTRSLTAVRILSHLKMHDATLYACSSCSYYHYKKEIVEKHLSEVHKDSRLMIVREQSNSTDNLVSTQTSSAPTMDLKPWQCGLCKFKTMLHPEVVTHCSKVHQSKMQFKCAYCPFRTSAIDNVSKHQTNAHEGKPEEVFYYFYREGTIPDEPDGTPRWVRQRQKAGPLAEPEVKVETRNSVSPVLDNSSHLKLTPMSVDLNLVKKEVIEEQTTAQNKSIEDLCNIFGPFGEPNGIKFKCPLCSVITIDSREMMQFHLYEELNYRKWTCGLCSYKAFHKVGLTDHMVSEHRRQYDCVELPTDENIERWVKSLLDHQTIIIEFRKNNLMKQKIMGDVKTASSTPAKSGVATVRPGPSTEVSALASVYTDEELQKAFGTFGENKENMFCCPKCDLLTTDADVIRDHLEIELNKIRWYCSNCPCTYQTYHEARFHCKGHDGPSRPVEAIRDSNMRAAWVTTAIQKQKNGIQSSAASCSEHSTPEKGSTYSDSDNSLLVVRYEERVPTPDQIAISRKRPAPDSDDEKLIIDEAHPKQKPQFAHCIFCAYKSNNKSNLKTHMLKHYNLKPYSCGYCEFNGSSKTYVLKHCHEAHRGNRINIKRTELPANAIKTLDGDAKLVCLVCLKFISQPEVFLHLHDNVRPAFSTSRDVLKCVCSKLCVDPISMQEHYKIDHPHEVVYYTPYKIMDFETYECIHCFKNFIEFDDFKLHHTIIHKNLPFKIEISKRLPGEVKSNSTVRRFAKKSTTKLPKQKTVAKKSTTKLPYDISDSEDEYSYYGSKPPSLEQYSNVTTLMSFCNKMVPFTMTQLSQHLNIDPVVLVVDDKSSSD